jgi:hypothetical protein
VPVSQPGIRNQTQLDDLLDFSGTITTGGAAQIVLPQQLRRLSLSIWNTSAANMTVGIGPPRPTATLSSSTVGSITVGNAGIGYTVPPVVRLLGGIVDGDYQTAPSHPATAHATLSGTGIGSITVDDPGIGYKVAPLIYLENPIVGPFGYLGGGCFLPSISAGIPLPPGGGLNFGGSLLVPASALAVWGTNTNDAFAVKVGGLV